MAVWVICINFHFELTIDLEWPKGKASVRRSFPFWPFFFLVYYFVAVWFLSKNVLRKILFFIFLGLGIQLFSEVEQFFNRSGQGILRSDLLRDGMKKVYQNFLLGDYQDTKAVETAIFLDHIGNVFLNNSDEISILINEDLLIDNLKREKELKRNFFGDHPYILGEEPAPRGFRLKINLTYREVPADVDEQIDTEVVVLGSRDFWRRKHLSFVRSVDKHLWAKDPKFLRDKKSIEEWELFARMFDEPYKFETPRPSYRLSWWWIALLAAGTVYVFHQSRKRLKDKKKKTSVQDELLEAEDEDRAVYS